MIVVVILIVNDENDKQRVPEYLVIMNIRDRQLNEDYDDNSKSTPDSDENNDAP